MAQPCLCDGDFHIIFLESVLRVSNMIGIKRIEETIDLSEFKEGQRIPREGIYRGFEINLGPIRIELTKCDRKY